VSGGWGGVDTAAAYARTCALLCAGAHDDLVEALGGSDALAGRRVLDAGCGDGRLTARLSAAGATLTACDADPQMAALAGRTVPTADVVVAALPRLPLADAAVQATVAAFVVNHLAAPAAGVRELTRVTAPGGVVAVTIWPSGRNAQARLWGRVLDDAGVQPVASTRLPAHLDFARTEEGLADLMTAQGLQDVSARTLAWQHRGPAEQLWEGAAAGIGGIGTTVAGQPDDVRRRLRAAYDEHVAALLVDGELSFTTEAVLATGVVAQTRRSG